MGDRNIDIYMRRVIPFKSRVIQITFNESGEGHKYYVNIFDANSAIEDIQIRQRKRNQLANTFRNVDFGIVRHTQPKYILEDFEVPESCGTIHAQIDLLADDMIDFQELYSQEDLEHLPGMSFSLQPKNRDDQMKMTVLNLYGETIFDKLNYYYLFADLKTTHTRSDLTAALKSIESYENKLRKCRHTSNYMTNSSFEDRFGDISIS